jgi:hypothetical protein
MNVAGAKAARLRGTLERHGTMRRIYDRQAIPAPPRPAIQPVRAKPVGWPRMRRKPSEATATPSKPQNRTQTHGKHKM